ncbi:tetratricopeptide repeat protein [Micromonospora trifolii]|uniref:tetratricopeptide repeat protein n=1 Tax=Micromonospora trifolii TaxID=2911208 RepID=UPI003D2EA3F2
MGRFIGIAVSKYEQDRHEPLRHAVPDATAFAELLGADFVSALLADPGENTARDRLRGLAGEHSDGPLVLLWAGHGIGSPTGLRLLASDSGSGPAAGIGAMDVAAYCASSGSSQLLLILDACFSGEGLPAVAVAAEVMQQLPVDGEHLWVGVLTSCMAVETAQDGLLGELLRSLLAHGPESAMLRLRWSVHNQSIRGDDLCDAVIKEWPGPRQTPQFQGRGSAWWMFPNPLFDPGAPEQVVEHLLRAARGGAREDERSWFTGRTTEVNQVVTWVRAGKPGVYVVTGSAGTGKSAITGRVVSLSNPHERARLLTEGRPWEHDDPGERSIHAHVHARGLSVDQAAELIAGQLVRSGVLPPQATRRNAPELVGQVQRAVEAGTAPPVLVVDGVDESRGESFTLAEELVLRLSRLAVVVVSTRDLPRPGGGASVVSTLNPDGPGLDLDTGQAQERTRHDVVDYVAARLAGVDPAMNPALVAEHVGAGVAAADWQAGRPFLLARLVADQLNAAPVDTSSEDWQGRVAVSVEQAFDSDLATISAPPGPQRAGVSDHVAVARHLLAALSRGYGAGLPEDEWLTIANAGREPVGPFGRDDLSWLLDQLGRYIVQDGEGGAAVYRVAHQSLADHLRSPFRATHQQVFDPDAYLIADALASLYRARLDAGVNADRPIYLWRYFWRHAADAGPDGLHLIRLLTEADPALKPDVAVAGLLVAERFRRWGYRQEALKPTEEAVTVYRELVATNSAFIPDLADALNNLGIRYGEVGRRTDAVAPTEEAVTAYRELAATNPAFLPELAAALNNLGIRYSEIGRRPDAVAPSEEAGITYRKLAATNPAFLPALAATLNNLGNHYSEVGRRPAAVAPTEEAVTAYRELAATNPAFLPDLATALNNLGNRYSEVGRRPAAVAPTEEAVTVYRKLVATNPAFLPDLAGALNNLGISYGEVGRRTDAVAPTEEAVTAYRELAATNPAFLPDLAAALNNLGIRYNGVGRRSDAVAPTEEAVTLRRELAATNPAFLPALAGALNNLGIRYNGVGRRTDAVAPTEEAVTAYRELAATNPAFLPDLAAALNNLGIRYSGVGRRSDAVAPTEEAVTLRRELAATNPAFLPDLAAALNNLGNRYNEVGRRPDAVAPTEEAVTTYRELAATNPAFLPDLAAALNNLGNRYSGVGRRPDAVAPTEEAVTTYGELAATNPAFLPALAGALNNLGNRYNEVGRRPDAVAPTEEAVTAYRELAATNPAFLPDLAGALNNLGIRYSEIGRRPDAVAPTEEAVTTYRELAATNPAFLPDLASALNNLGNRYSEAGRPTEQEAIWRAVLADAPPPDIAYLLFIRIAAAEAGDSGALDWFAMALRQTPADRALLGALHDQARRHRRPDPDRFDRAWIASVGDLPEWLTLDPDLLVTAQQWISTADYQYERDFLAAHPELLAPAADSAVTDALLTVNDQAAQRYLTLRNIARTNGVATAYAPLLLTILAAEFAAADPLTQTTMLTEHNEELLTDSAREALAALAQRDTSGTADRADAVLALAQVGAAEPALNALIHPEKFTDLMAAIAESPDPTALDATAFLARTSAQTDVAAATADFYTAVASALADDVDEATDVLTTARRLAPEQTAAWINRLATIGRRHPAALNLISVLTIPDEQPGAP